MNQHEQIRQVIPVSTPVNAVYWIKDKIVKRKIVAWALATDETNKEPYLVGLLISSNEGRFWINSSRTDDFLGYEYEGENLDWEKFASDESADVVEENTDQNTELLLSVSRNKDRTLRFSAKYKGKTSEYPDWNPLIHDSSDIYNGLKEAFEEIGLEPDATFRKSFIRQFEALEDQYHKYGDRFGTLE